ncbi:MAG TPA: tetratricopeptide repeat protein [Polyangia bacterium]
MRTFGPVRGLSADRPEIAAPHRVPPPLRASLVLSLIVSLAAASCAHGVRPAPLSEASRQLAREAASFREIRYEEDFIDARLVYRALPPETPERMALRKRLLTYLLGPLRAIDADPDRRKGALTTDDDLDRTLASFRDALDLYSPTELWRPNGEGIPADEKLLINHAAKLVAALFAPRGSEVEVATALLVLTTLEPNNRAFSDRLAELLPWLETGAQLSLGGGPNPQEVPTVTDALESAASVWPAPPVVERLDRAYLSRQEKIAALLRRPLGAPNGRPAVGELVLEGDGVQSTAMNLTGLYLRAGQIQRAKDALARAAGKPGDDPELRKLVDRAAGPRASRDDLVSLARRFLPQIDLFAGTSNDRIDFVAASELLHQAVARFPDDTEVRLLASRVAFVTQDLYLSVRYLEEAEPLLAKRGASRDERVAVAAELLDRSFAKLRQRLMDAEHFEPAAREAEVLRARFADSQRRFGAAELKTRNSDIDFEMARGLLNAGSVEKAEQLFTRVLSESPGRIEVALELGRLAIKQGDPRRAIALLEPTLATAADNAQEQETIGGVETEAKLAYALGNAYEVAGNLEGARKAWRQSLRGWDRLMREHQQRKNPGPAAEATLEVGRLVYLLGRPTEGIAKLFEGIELNEARDSSYLDALSFLVQRGDVDAAVDLFKLALSRPSRVVSEYVKVYASLWIADLTRRAGRGPEPWADQFLKTLANRRIHLRPQRVAFWYEQLARFSLGQVSYAELLPRADTAGKQAELHFYEAMRRLADGQTNEATALWNKVIETRMVEFLEFDMAARYLRVGAPTRPPMSVTSGETI